MKDQPADIPAETKQLDGFKKIITGLMPESGSMSISRDAQLVNK